VIVGLVALGAALSAVGGWRYARASAPVSGPIVLLSIDALRADRLPVYGYANTQTPAIDALARDGIVFDRAYAHAPQTLPAHASLLSGRLPPEVGVRDTVGFAVPEDERLLAEMLADRGYGTAAVVSSYALREETGLARGFDFYDDNLAGEMESAITRDGAAAASVAAAWLGREGAERAFLFLHIHELHAPRSQSYDAAVAEVDGIVGGFIKYLKTHQLYDQSTIVLTADHGEGLGERGETGHGVLAHEAALRVPLIIKPAAGKGAGRRITALVQHVDIVPTILDLAKAPKPGELAGVSLNPVLDGDSTLPARVVYSESLFAAYRFGWAGVRTVTDGRYRLIRRDADQLFDVVADPAERHDLADTHPTELARLRSVLDRISAEDPLHAPSAQEAEVRQRLAALGYVGPVAPYLYGPPRDGVAPDGQIDVIETYRAAMTDAAAREWPSALSRLEGLVRRYPRFALLWHELGEMAMAGGRFDRAVEAFGRTAVLAPESSQERLAAATALLRLRRLDEAREQAEAALALSAEGHDAGRAQAHEILARIAVAGRDAAAAREHAELAREADPTLPMPAYVDGRFLYDAGQFDEAVPVFQSALADLEDSGTRVLDLQYYLGDSLARLERSAEAEYHLLEELRAFPHNVRARGALASLYHQTGRPDEAADALTAMIRVSPTPEGFALAARLWTAFGEPSHAAAVRAEAARRLAAQPPRPDASSTQ
jgi:arylsulfatase A-like enzyme/tetratricopeptide (TPR) repeat protein